MLADFIEGDFEMIRVFVNALNEGQPGLNLGDDTVESLETIMRRLRDVLLGPSLFAIASPDHASRTSLPARRQIRAHAALRDPGLAASAVLLRHHRSCVRVDAAPQLTRPGLRLTLQLARVTLAIPMAVDKAMREDAEREALASADPQALSQGRGLLNKRVACVLCELGCG